MCPELPKSYDKLATEFKQLYSRSEGMQSQIEYLEEMVKLLQRNRFGAKNEQIAHPSLVPLFPEIEDKIEDNKSDNTEETEVSGHTRKKNKKELPESLPREDIYCDLDEAQKACPCCKDNMSIIKENFSEKLHVIPAKFVVKKFITPVYSCKKCEEIKQATLPYHPIPKCGVTLETLAYIAMVKYVDGLPLYRLEKIFDRSKVDIKRDRMSRWIISLSEKLAPIKARMQSDLLKSKSIAMDETTLQVLKEKGRRADQKSFMIVQAREGPPGKKITVFHYEKSRSKETIAQYLDGFSGSLVTDGLATYQSYCQFQNSISHGGCWAHARRKLMEAVKGKKRNNGLAKQILLLVNELFKIERDLNTDEEKLAARKEKSQSVINEIKLLIDDKVLSIPKKSLTGNALNYVLNQWEMLTKFLSDPKLPIHNNYIERQIRTYVIGRKAWLFADTTSGAHANALFYSILNTARENNLNINDYLVKILSAPITSENIESMLPYNN